MFIRDVHVSQGALKTGRSEVPGAAEQRTKVVDVQPSIALKTFAILKPPSTAVSKKNEEPEMSLSDDDWNE